MNTYKDELREFVGIYEYIDEMEKMLLHNESVVDEDDAYQRLYEKAFSEKVNGRLQEIFGFDWCDPDTTYEEDYRAWKNGLETAVEKVKSLLEMEV